MTVWDVNRANRIRSLTNTARIWPDAFRYYLSAAAKISSNQNVNGAQINKKFDVNQAKKPRFLTLYRIYFLNLMNNLKKVLKETFKPRERRAAIGGILAPLLILGIVVAGVVVIATTFFDAADTASIIESIDVSNPALYSDQGFVTVQVKNNGNTAIEGVYAVLLVDDTGTNVATPVGYDCEPGIEPALITTDSTGRAAGATVSSTTLNPGESITISGGLYTIGTITIDTNNNAVTTATTPTVFICDGTTGDLEDRGEYILQINGNSDGDVISKTVTIRAR